MNSETPSLLINQTFLERLNAEQDTKRKEFTKLKSIDADKQNNKISQEKLRQKEHKNRCMVFNYLWHRFPEAMAARNYNPTIIRQASGDSEFERILKAARRYYGSWVVGSSVMLAGNTAATVLNIEFSFPLFIISFLMLSFSSFVFGSATNYYLHPAYAANIDKRKKLQELYKNSRK